MPIEGFTKIIENILTHENIVVELNVNAKDRVCVDLKKNVILFDGCEVPVIWTGALDELFDFKYGKLPYRSLRFEWKTINKDSYQDAPVVAYPQEKEFTRITEYKKLPIQKLSGKTTVAVEYPVSVTNSTEIEPYYPIPTEFNQEMYQKYRIDADKVTNLTLCGRLAEYRYYNMDLVIDRAMKVCLGE